MMQDAAVTKPQKSGQNRISVGLSDEEHAELRALAEKYRVSMAWLGRQAITEFLDKYQKQELELPIGVISEKGAGQQQLICSAELADCPKASGRQAIKCLPVMILMRPAVRPLQRPTAKPFSCQGRSKT